MEKCQINLCFWIENLAVFSGRQASCINQDSQMGRGKTKRKPKKPRPARIYSNDPPAAQNVSTGGAASSGLQRSQDIISTGGACSSGEDPACSLPSSSSRSKPKVSSSSQDAEDEIGNSEHAGEDPDVLRDKLARHRSLNKIFLVFKSVKNFISHNEIEI